MNCPFGMSEAGHILIVFELALFEIILVIINEWSCISIAINYGADEHPSQADCDEQETRLFIALTKLSYLLLWFDYLSRKDGDESHRNGLKEAHARISHS